MPFSIITKEPSNCVGGVQAHTTLEQVTAVWDGQLENRIISPSWHEFKQTCFMIICFLICLSHVPYYLSKLIKISSLSFGTEQVMLRLLLGESSKRRLRTAMTALPGGYSNLEDISQNHLRIKAFRNAICGITLEWALGLAIITFDLEETGTLARPQNCNIPAMNS